MPGRVSKEERERAERQRVVNRVAFGCDFVLDSTKGTVTFCRDTIEDETFPFQCPEHRAQTLAGIKEVQQEFVESIMRERSSWKHL